MFYNSCWKRLFVWRMSKSWYLYHKWQKLIKKQIPNDIHSSFRWPVCRAGTALWRMVLYWLRCFRCSVWQLWRKRSPCCPKLLLNILFSFWFWLLHIVFTCRYSCLNKNEVWCFGTWKLKNPRMLVSCNLCWSNQIVAKCVNTAGFVLVPISLYCWWMALSSG